MDRFLKNARLVFMTLVCVAAAASISALVMLLHHGATFNPPVSIDGRDWYAMNPQPPFPRDGHRATIGKAVWLRTVHGERWLRDFNEWASAGYPGWNGPGSIGSPPTGSMPLGAAAPQE
jgi:hypothetical protein